VSPIQRHDALAASFGARDHACIGNNKRQIGVSVDQLANFLRCLADNNPTLSSSFNVLVKMLNVAGRQSASIM
jgi:hypothetical protein